MDELRQQVDKNIASCLTSYATNADVVSRQLYGRAVVQVLYQPLNRILDDIRTVVSTLLMVSEDADASVRAHLLDQFPEIFIRCRERQELGYYLYDSLMDIVLRYLKDGDTQVRRNAYYAITDLLEKRLLDAEQIEAKVCPAVVELTKHPVLMQQQQIDYHTKAVELMGQLAPTIGRDKTKEYFLDRFIEMSTDSVYYVRKSCADFFPVLCQVMGTEETAKELLPIFMQLCQDSEWGVRKSAAESFTKVALMCSLNDRQEYLAPLLFKLLNDSNRWVSFSAFKYLGQFISSFAQPCITGLAYTNQGELFITNAADFNITHQSDMELLNNFKYYTNMFNESMASNKSLPIHAANTNDYAAAASNTNPYQKFLAPEAFANIGFIPNSTTLPPPPPPPPLNISADSDMISSSSSSLLLSESIVESGSAGGAEFIKEQSYYSEFSAIVNNLNNFNKSNNNEAVIEPTPLNSTLSNVPNENDTSSSTNDSTISNNNSSFSNLSIANDGCNEGNNNNSITAPNIIDNNDTTEQPPLPPPIDISDKATVNAMKVNTIESTDQLGVHLRKNTPHGLPLIIKNAMEIRSMSSKEIRRSAAMSLKIPKNIDQPLETPSIESAPQTIDFQLNNNKTRDETMVTECSDERVEKKNLLNTAQTYNCIGNSIGEDTKCTADSKSITASNTTNTNTTATDEKRTDEWDEKFSELFNIIKLSDNNNIKNENKSINALVDECNEFADNSSDSSSSTSRSFSNNSSSIIEMSTSISTLDDDETLKQFNSANYWYVNPDLPLDLDNFEKDDFGETFPPFKGPTTPSFQNNKNYNRKINNVSPSGGELPTGFKQDIVPSYLVEYFVSMVSLDDLDMTASCAYNFPAVVLTLGRENWHLLHYLLYSLCSDIQWKIRKTVAVSIYPIALIIGSELATKDLVPIFLGFFKDLDVVKVEALRNLDDFLKVVNLSEHYKIVMALGDCLKTDNDANWRFREELAHQVLLLIKTYGLTYSVDCMIYLTGIAFMLLTDKVNSVREIALDAIVAKFVISSSLEVSHLTNMLLNEFAKHSHWRRRQIYTSFCHKCIVRCSLSEEMISHLIVLAQDKVPNVRLSVAKCLKDILYGNGRSNLTEEQCMLFAQNLDFLLQDSDRDVRNCSQNDRPLSPNEMRADNCSASFALNETFDKIMDSTDATAEMTNNESCNSMDEQTSSSEPQMQIDNSMEIMTNVTLAKWSRLDDEW